MLLSALVAGCGGSSNEGNNIASVERVRQVQDDARRQQRAEDHLHELEQKYRDLRKAPAAAPGHNSSPSASPDTSTPTTCPGTTDLTVGPATSCAFAQNVRDAYAYSDSSGGSATLDVYSPTTQKSYTMSCSGGSPHHCTGGNDASVTFP